MDSQMIPSNPSNDTSELNTTMYLGKQTLNFTVIIIIFLQLQYTNAASIEVPKYEVD